MSHLNFSQVSLGGSENEILELSRLNTEVRVGNSFGGTTGTSFQLYFRSDKILPRELSFACHYFSYTPSYQRCVLLFTIR